jgi:hypothetical protein
MPLASRIMAHGGRHDVQPVAELGGELGLDAEYQKQIKLRICEFFEDPLRGSVTLAA